MGSLHQFAATWADGGNTMIAYNRPMQTGEATEPTQPTEPAEPPVDETWNNGGASTILLPVTLRCHEGALIVSSDAGEAP